MSALDPVNPEQDFVVRTRKLVEEYTGEGEFSLLLNCLMGLVIVPKETMLAAIPNDPITKIKWGIDGQPMIQWGQCKSPITEGVKALVTKVRHATAHFQIKCIADMTERPAEWKSVEFKADKNFKAVFTYDQLKSFVFGVCN